MLVLSFVCLHVVLGGNFKKNRPLPYGSKSPYSAAEGYTVYNKPKGDYTSSGGAACSSFMHWLIPVKHPIHDCNCDPCSPDYDWCDYNMEQETGGTWHFNPTGYGGFEACERQWVQTSGSQTDWSCNKIDQIIVDDKDGTDCGPSAGNTGYWTCDWQCNGIIGEKMQAMMMLTQLMGRRRLTDADQAVCAAVTEHATELETYAKILRDAQDGVDVEADEKKLGEEIWAWCDEKVSGDRRRASEFDVNAYGDLSGRLERFRETSHADWAHFRQHVTNLTGEQRRLQDPIQEARRRSTELPADIWYQCRGYAYAMVQLIASYSDEAANVFVMKANSDNPEHQQEACASIVNHVNAAVEAEQIPDIELLDETTEGATDVVATYGQIAVTRSEDVGVALGLQKLEVVFAGVATTVYAMFAICKSYATYEALGNF